MERIAKDEPVATRPRERRPQTLMLRVLQLPKHQQNTNHSKNHEHKFTNPPDLDIHQRHKAVEVSDDAIVRLDTQRLPPLRLVTRTVYTR
ncbi:hypothetical protein Bca52824_041645 [Brassica carinata]|uniref:Uncharacterized protein n=1 Tax=Brassica carinata TaxID=52824 RepID=A0A8X7UZ04_BRACI|nr:hypothetical protein Bca52824_041645 [Brassica carinata]